MTADNFSLGGNTKKNTQKKAIAIYESKIVKWNGSRRIKDSGYFYLAFYGTDTAQILRNMILWKKFQIKTYSYKHAGRTALVCHDALHGAECTIVINFSRSPSCSFFPFLNGTRQCALDFIFHCSCFVICFCYVSFAEKSGFVCQLSEWYED